MLFDVDITKVNFETETTGKRQSRTKGKKWKQTKSGYPKSILTFAYDKEKLHPTQKPIELYKWILENNAKQGDKILDTHLGSGSIAIACHDYGFDLTACELDKEYYDKAMERINNHTAQQKLFI